MTNDQSTVQQRLRRRAFLKSSLSTAAVGVAAAIGRNATGHGATQHTYPESLKTPIVARHEVVIAGGGPSGVIAAIAAARSGADTLLLERYGFLGGNGTAGLMSCYNGFRNQRPPEALQTVKGIAAEFISELVRLGGVADTVNYEMTVPHDVQHGDLPYAVPFDSEAAKVACLNLIRKEGVKLRLHSWVVAPMLDGTRVTGVITHSKSGRQAIAADVVVDCTGDGDLAAEAGAPFMSPASSGDRMPMTLMYRVGGLPAAVKDSFDGVRKGDQVVRWGPAIAGNGVNVETLSEAEIHARLEIWKEVQEMRSKPGMGSLFLAQTATGIGVRETRRIVGEYTVTEQDAIEGKHFSDVVAISSNPFPDYHGRRYFLRHEGFDIPYRALVPKNVDGLVLSGRCISCEQAPFQSARSMAPAMAIGHASGCAAALAATQRIPPRELDVKALQKLLLTQKAELRL